MEKTIILNDLEQICANNHAEKTEKRKTAQVKAKKEKKRNRIIYTVVAVAGCLAATAVFTVVNSKSTVDYRSGTVCADGCTIMTTDGNVWDQAQAFPAKSKVKVWFDNNGTEKTTDDTILKIERR